MYKITLTIMNPQTGAAKTITRKFDENAFSQTKWNGAYNAVQAEIDALKTASTPDEAPTW